MLSRVYIPQSPLSDFVELFWLYEARDPPHARERYLPTGTVELVIDLCDETLRVYDRQDHDRFQSFRGALVCGTHSGFFVIDVARQATIMGVHFKPGGAFPFLGLPACELRDMHVSLETLWGTKAGELRERLLEAETPEVKFRILEQALLAQTTRPLARHPAVAFALGEFQKRATRADDSGGDREDRAQPVRDLWQRYSSPPG